ncbi:MAG: hypothetical protein ACOCUU_03550 [Nanoarchaeota archaeon]
MLYHQAAIKDKRGIIYYVFGNQSFSDVIYAIPYYFPKEYFHSKFLPKNKFYQRVEIERVLKRGYFRIHNISKAFLLAKDLNCTLVVDKRFGIPIFALKKEDILKVYPLMNKKNYKILNQIENFFGIPKKNMAIIRSRSIGVDTPHSNIDIAIFGKNNFKKFYKDFDRFVLEKGYENYLNQRKQRHLNLLPPQYKNIKELFLKKRVFSFSDKNKSYDFYFINHKKETQNLSFIKDIGTFKIKAKIISSEESYFFPHLYKIKILGPKKNIPKFKSYIILYGLHLSGVFSKGDVINIKAKTKLISIDGKEVLFLFPSKFI